MQLTPKTPVTPTQKVGYIGLTPLLTVERTLSRRLGLCFLIHTKRQGDCDPKTIGIKVDLHIRTGLSGKHPLKANATPNPSPVGSA